MHFSRDFFWAVFSLKMLIQQVAKCKALLTKLTDSYLQNKNINMTSKIIFKIKLELIWFLLIRAKVLIILILIWVDIIDILIIKIRVFHNVIWLSRIEWLQSIFDNIFILFLIIMKVSISFKVRIIWSRFYYSSCASYNHQWLLCSRQC